MWTGNKPPLLPKSNKQTTGSPSTPVKTARTSKQNAELEALRQRGLTTLLNRHFTETTRQVAEEKAAVDAALKDLEERRARRGEFKSSFTNNNNNNELSPLDALYISVNQRRAECRRKEKETLLMYQRYVHKFGDSGQVQVPSAPQKQIPDWAREDTTPAQKENFKNHAAAAPIPTEAVSNMKRQIESALTEYLEKGGLEMPSVETLGKDKTFQQVFRQHQTEFQKYYLRQREKRGVDAKTTLPKTKEQVEGDRNKVYVGPGAFTAAQGGNDPFLRTIGDQPPSPSKETTTTKLTIEAPIDFYQDEDGFSRPYFVPQDFHADDDDDNDNDDDDRSIVSGLTTLNSVETRRVLQDCEKSVATFLYEEHKAIRKMMEEEGEEEEEEDNLTRVSSSEETVDESIRAADEAEHMVERMKGILDDFTNNQKNATVSDLIQENEKKCRPFETSNKEEDWVVYYDETYQREYYHERNTNRTQWEPPERDSTSQSDDDDDGGDDDNSSSVFTYEQVRPESSAARSRYVRYRRKQRRARRRRRSVVAALVGVGVLAGVLYLCGPQEAISELPSGVTRVTDQGVALYDRFVVAGSANEEALAEKQAMVQQKLVELVNKVYGYEQPRRVEEPGVLTTPPKEKLLCKRETREVFTRAIVASRQETVQEEKETTQQVAEDRPWVCHIPLAYLVNSRCRTMATIRPLFDLQALIASMMQ